MSEFHLVFTHDLSSISVPEGRVTLDALPSLTPPPVETYDADALATLNSIAGKLTDLECLRKSQLDQLQEQISSVAIDVARAVLNDEDALFQKRVQRYVQLAIDQVKPTAEKTVYVHPTCTVSILRWLAETEASSIEVKEDASILPGDCLVESGETGFAVTLDAFLDSVLKQIGADGRRDDT